MNEVEKIKIHNHVIIEETRREETIQEEIEGATEKSTSPKNSAPVLNEFLAKELLQMHRWDID